jgi:hypothetical protein
MCSTDSGYATSSFCKHVFLVLAYAFSLRYMYHHDQTVLISVFFSFASSIFPPTFSLLHASKRDLFYNRFPLRRKLTHEDVIFTCFFL